MPLQSPDLQHLAGQYVDSARLGNRTGQGHNPDDLLDGGVAEPAG